MHYKTCEICGTKAGRVGGEKRTFMTKFPLDEDRCKRWVQVTGNEDLAYVPIEKLHELKYICGKHFQLRDFKKKMTQLKRNAVPSMLITAKPLPDEILMGFPLHIFESSKSTVVTATVGEGTSNSKRNVPCSSRLALAPLIYNPEMDHDYCRSYVVAPEPSKSTVEAENNNNSKRKRPCSPNPSTLTVEAENNSNSKRKRPCSPSTTCGDFYHWQGSYLGDHTYAIMDHLTEVNFKQEADVQYSPTMAECVKEDPECVNKLKQLSYSDIAMCEENETLASPYIDNLKNEIVFSPLHVKELPLRLEGAKCEESQLTRPYTNMVKDELVLIPEHIKEECGMSEAAIANLYTDHVVKDEIVLGPEHPHRPDVALAVRSWVLPDADSWSVTPALKRVRPAQLKQVKDCSVRLERLPSDATMLAGNQTKATTTHAETISDTEKKYTSRKSLCGLCGEAFTLKADLIKHVMRHIHMPSSMEEEERLLSNYEKLRSSIRDCWVKLERCDSTDNKPAETIMPSSENETAMQKTHTAEINAYICDMCSRTFQEKHSLVAHIKMHVEKSHMLLKNKNVLTNKLNIVEWKRKRPYTCELCKKVFKLHRELIRHEIRHSGQKPYSCLICFKRFARLDYIKLHTETVHNDGERSFSCEICQRKFKRSACLERHKLIHTNRQQYYCKICNKSFKGLDYLKRHTNIHLERKHQCNLCDKKFTFSSCLKRHQRVHDGLKPYSCEICSKKFALLNTLKNHLKTHTGKKSECDICKKRFADLACLKSHMRLHEGIKRFKCEICSKSFMHLSTLKKHKLTHVGEKKHVCEICDKRFLLPDTLKNHIKNIHMKIKP